MKRAHPFRFEERDSARGRVYYVRFDADPAHPKATGVLVSEGLDTAVAWAYAHQADFRGPDPTFGAFANGFFDETSPWVRRRRSKGYTWHVQYLPARRGFLENYLMPRWRTVPLSRISVRAIDEWLMDLDSVQNDAPLAAATKDRLLVTMRQILDQARYEGLIQDNPAEHVEPFSRRGGKERLPFTMEEIRRLFPESLDEALRIWLSPQWYAFFLMQWTCGLRPGEAAGFMLSDWLPNYHGAVIRRSIEAVSLRPKGLKTEKSGATVKPVVFSDRLEEILRELERDGAAPDELLFRLNGQPIRLETANKHFKASAIRAGVELGERTQYSLRHTYYTELLKRLPEKEVARMAGHRALRKEYDHRQGVDFLRQAQPLREVVNELSA